MGKAMEEGKGPEKNLLHDSKTKRIFSNSRFQVLEVLGYDSPPSWAQRCTAGARAEKRASGRECVCHAPLRARTRQTLARTASWSCHGQPPWAFLLQLPRTRVLLQSVSQRA